MAVWVRRRYDLRLCSVLRIWVDSESSAVGGRELWGIRKELGTFAIQDGNPFAARVGAIEKDITVLRFETSLAFARHVARFLPIGAGIRPAPKTDSRTLLRSDCFREGELGVCR